MSDPEFNFDLEPDRKEIWQQLSYAARTIETSVLVGNGAGLISIITVIANTAAMPSRMKTAVIIAWTPGTMFLAGLVLGYLYYIPASLLVVWQYKYRKKDHRLPVDTIEAANNFFRPALQTLSGIFLTGSAFFFFSGVLAGANGLWNLAHS